MEAGPAAIAGLDSSGARVPASSIGDAVDALTDLVVVVDGQGRISYGNEFAHRLLGLAPGALVGRSVIDILHADDVERALLNIGRVADPGVTLPVTPAFYRFVAGDGSYVRIELNAAPYGASDGTRLLVVGRPSTDTDLQEQLIDLLTGEGDSAAAFALLPRFPSWRQPDLEFAVFHLDDDGVPAAAGSPLLVGLGGLDDADTPWSLASRSGLEVWGGLDELDPAFAARAAAVGGSGLLAVRARPVPDRLFARPAVAVAATRTEARLLGDIDVLRVAGYVLDRFAANVGLVVSWRAQVGELRRAASTDPLTGIANRAGFWTGLATRTRPETGRAVVLVCLDLDRFKPVNDTYGHAVGDRVLVALAERLRAAVGVEDVVARLGGDEFAVVSTVDGDPGSYAAELAARLRAAVEAPFAVGEDQVRVGVSVGWATAPAGGVDPDALFEQADAALYAAKATTPTR